MPLACFISDTNQELWHFILYGPLSIDRIYDYSYSCYLKSVLKSDGHQLQALFKLSTSSLFVLQSSVRKIYIFVFHLHFPENLICLSGNEERNERSRLLAAQRAEEEKKRKEEEIQHEVEQRVKRREQRNKVISEIIETEKNYLFSLHLCLETFLDAEVCFLPDFLFLFHIPMVLWFNFFFGLFDKT